MLPKKTTKKRSYLYAVLFNNVKNTIFFQRKNRLNFNNFYQLANNLPDLKSKDSKLYNYNF